jgi:hypothetical protein
MSSLVVVLDASVLFPSSLRDTLLRAADANLYELRWTDEILEEVRRNLISKRSLSSKQAQGLLDEMRGYFSYALVTEIEVRMPPCFNRGMKDFPRSYPPCSTASAVVCLE